MVVQVAGDDYELWRAWADGDKAAGNALAQRHFVAIYRFFRSKLPDHADELTQATFLACVEGHDRYRGDGKFRGYLYGIARKQLLRHLEGRGQLMGGRPLTEMSIEDLAPSPSAAAAGRQRRDVLLAALRAIPIDFQIVLELHYWDDLTTAEIASALEVPAGTVKSRLSRARDHLRRQLKLQAATMSDADLGAATAELRDALDPS